MRSRLAKFLERVWYGGSFAGILLAPLSWVYRALFLIQRKRKIRQRTATGVPVIVVGNITVGGTGKTPIVIWLTERLRAHGFSPGIVTRGYLGGGSRPGSLDEPLRVSAETHTEHAGDEAVLLARRTACPVVACADRRRAALSLVADGGVDIVVSDDGLQHFALQSDCDIVIVDGARGLGNGRLLPAGPLREPATRLDTAALILVNGSGWSRPDALRFDLKATMVTQLSDGAQLPLGAFAGRRVHAVAAIGNPDRFFAMLRDHGCIVEGHPWPDHAPVPPDALEFADGAPVLVTEKDAVKWRQTMPDEVWCVIVDVAMDSQTEAKIMRKISERTGRDGQRA